MGERGRTVRAALVIAFGAYVLLMWLPVAWSGRWIADDYCFAASSWRDGFWQSQALVYNSAAGRITVAFLYAAITRLGSWTSRWLAIGAVTLWIVAAWRVARSLFERPIEQLAAAIGFVAAVMNAAPDTYQPLVWTGGLFTYGLPCIGATVLAALLLRKSHPLLLAVIAFALGGCSEVAAVAQIVFSIAMGVVSRQMRAAFAAIAAGSLIALLVVSVAPGNFKRRALFHPQRIPAAMTTAIVNTPAMYVGIVVEGSTMFVPLVAFLALGARLRPRYAFPAFAASVFVVTATLFGAFVGTGRLPWGRVQFVPVAYVAMAIVSVALSLRIERYALLATGLIVAFGLIGVIGSASTRMQWIREAREFAAAADRVERTASADRGAHVVVPAPHSYDYLEYLAREPEHWSNRCMARYYFLESIRSGR